MSAIVAAVPVPKAAALRSTQKCAVNNLVDPEVIDAMYRASQAGVMPRNLDRRVEPVVPVADPDLKKEIEQFLDLDLADNTPAWELGRDGTWRKVGVGRGIDTQELMQRATLGVVKERGVRAE